MCSVLQSGLSSSCFAFKCNIFLFLSLLCYSSSTEQFVLKTLSHNPTLFNFNGTLGSCSVPEIKDNNSFETIIILPSSKNCFGKLRLQLLCSSSSAIIAKCSLFPFPGRWPSHICLCGLFSSMSKV